MSNSNTESLLSLLQKYENSFEEPKKIDSELLITEIQQIKNESSNLKQNITVMELEYSPQSVHYFKHKNYHYRREVDFNGNILWETVYGNLRHKIEDDYQIKVLERRILGILD